MNFCECFVTQRHFKPHHVSKSTSHRQAPVDRISHKTLPDPAKKTRRTALVLQAVNLIERGLVRIKRNETITHVGDQLMATARERERPGENQPLETLAEAHIDSSAADYASLHFPVEGIREMLCCTLMKNQLAWPHASAKSRRNLMRAKAHDTV